MLLQEVFPCLPLESRQHGVSRTCKLIIAQFKMKLISRRALCPFPFTETGSKANNIGHTLVRYRHARVFIGFFSAAFKMEDFNE